MLKISEVDLPNKKKISASYMFATKMALVSYTVGI